MSEKKYTISCPKCNKPIELLMSDIEWGSVMCDNCDEFIQISRESVCVEDKSYTVEESTKTENSSSNKVEKDVKEKVSNPINPPTESYRTDSVNVKNIKDIDVVLSITSIKRMGLISIICAILNPIVTLICGVLGKKRGEELYGVPRELKGSLGEAIEYNAKGIKVSIIVLVIEAIAALIGIIAFLAECV